MVFPNAIRVVNSTVRGNYIRHTSLQSVAFFHHRSTVCAKDGLFGFFKKDTTKEEVTEVAETQTTSAVESNESAESSVPKRRKGQLTPEELENTIKKIVMEYTKADDSTWRKVKFDDKTAKFELLQRCMVECQREIPNVNLNNMQGTQDLLQFYLHEDTPFKSVHPVAEWFEKNKAQFPPNMYFVKYDKKTKNAHSH
ncbi:hypothetical protein K7432_000919 [Basidiobolus ranarum]|uniref:Large ribosomal subunit protein mL50 n=1 Tax=Basidiobolus ranarum TaxID=34480 RepID=A0ABR2X456_9FUNG